MHRFTIAIILAAIFLVAAAVPARAAEWAVEDVIAAYVKERHPWATIDVTGVQIAGRRPATPPQDVVMTAGTLPGRATFAFEFADGKRLAVTALVRAYERVVMPRRPFAGGYTLRDDDLYETLMDATRIPRNAVSVLAEAAGKALTRSVVPNAPVTADMVSGAAVVKSGARVVLLFEAPGFVIRTTGELKQRGAVGEHVKVMNTASRKILTGLLVDEGTVKVGF